MRVKRALQKLTQIVKQLCVYLIAQWCSALCDPPGSSDNGIFTSFSRDLNWGSFKFALVFTPLLSALLGSQSESLGIYSSPSPWFSDSQKIMSTETDLHFPQVDPAPISWAPGSLCDSRCFLSLIFPASRLRISPVISIQSPAGGPAPVDTTQPK